MKPKYRYKKRVFLNEEHNKKAYIIADVRFGSKYHSPTLEIGDCIRSINLEFDIENDKKLLDKLEKKINLFVGIINDWAKAMKEEIDSRRTEPELIDDEF